MRPNTEADIWARIDQRGGPDACWPWLGPVSHNGYGIHARLFGRYWRAHRLVHFIETGEEPEHVAHRCDNPICCNPKHLFSATAKENVHDCWRKGRKVNPPGEAAYSKKLTAAKVREIRSLEIRTIAEAKFHAQRFGIHHVHLYRLRRGECWREEVQYG